jgi:nucleoside-diphosphate-sugar epimerase
MDEQSPTNPLTTYAEANLRAEESALELHKKGTDMAVVLYRQATMYGLSPRMRFDIAVNGMTFGMWQNGSIPLLRDGTQWRPMIHIRDTSKAFIAGLAAPKENIAGERFNVGSNEQNYQILQLGELVSQGIGRKFEYTWYGDPDHRSYKVNFDKIKNVLGFIPDWTPDKGAAEIAKALESGEVKPDIKTKTLAWYSELMEWEKRIKELAPDGVIL